MTLRPVALILALACGVGSSLLVGCGSKDDSGLIAATNASQLVSHLESLQNAVDLGKCPATNASLQQLEKDLSQLPTSVDKDLKHELRSGYDKLSKQADTECRQVATQRNPVTTAATTTTTESVPQTTADSVPTTPTTTASEPPQTTSTENNGGVSPVPTTTSTPTTPPPGVTSPDDTGVTQP
jgi:hypothetical protein